MANTVSWVVAGIAYFQPAAATPNTTRWVTAGIAYFQPAAATPNTTRWVPLGIGYGTLPDPVPSTQSHTVLNVKRTVFTLVFTGRAWWFDGKKYTRAPSPPPRYLAAVASSGDTAAVAGGIDEDYNSSRGVYVYGASTYMWRAPRDTMVTVTGDDNVCVINSSGDTVKDLGRTGTALLDRDSVLASRKKFKVAYIVLK